MADMLSQEEIDALLNGGSSDETEPESPEVSSEESAEPASSPAPADEEITPQLSAEEKDAIGEIGNISMGTAATTLFTLLGQKVNITTPRVSETTFKGLEDEFVAPCVLIKIKYTVGIEGVNLLILKENDVKIITDLMMGGDGTNLADELTDLHLSAISEAMNQMIGSSSTSLSEMLGEKIDISPPEANYKKIDDITQQYEEFQSDSQLVRIAFRMTIGDLIDSEIMQIIPVQFAKSMVSKLMKIGTGEVQVEPVAETAPEPTPAPAPMQQPIQQPIQQPVQQVQQPVQNVQAQSFNNQQQYDYQGQNMGTQVPRQQVNAQPLQFDSFDGGMNTIPIPSDIELIKDVPLEITVELGRASKKISEILDFAQGTVIELDKLVGESLDILANGKKIAKGEVVVVDENYGIRITDIIIPEKRLNKL